MFRSIAPPTRMLDQIEADEIELWAAGPGNTISEIHGWTSESLFCIWLLSLDPTIVTTTQTLCLSCPSSGRHQHNRSTAEHELRLGFCAHLNGMIAQLQPNCVNGAASCMSKCKFGQDGAVCSPCTPLLRRSRALRRSPSRARSRSRLMQPTQAADNVSFVIDTPGKPREPSKC